MTSSTLEDRLEQLFWPTTAEKRAVAVQLAAYRLAWVSFGLAAVLPEVRAAFYYVRDDVTVRPADLLDGDYLAALIDDWPLPSLGHRAPWPARAISATSGADQGAGELSTHRDTANVRSCRPREPAIRQPVLLSFLHP